MIDKYEKFKQLIQSAAFEFLKIKKTSTVRIISHLDSDGISACSILIKALSRDNRKYSITIVQQLDENAIMQFAKEPYEIFFFTDLGSGAISSIREHLTAKKVFILDHHELESNEQVKNVTHVNPHLIGIDGSQEISGAGVVFFFAYAMNKANADMAHIAIVGAIGDVQEHNGFSKLNNEILEIAKENKTIKVIQGLRVFGAQTRPLHKLLEYSSENPIPGVTGSESGSIQFLHQIGINPKNGNEWRRLVDLSEEELKILITEVVMARLGEKNPEAVIGPVYILCGEETSSPTKDAKEFSTLLNACGRLNKASLGIGTCLNDSKIKQKAIALMQTYKKEIANALKWYDDFKDSEFVLRGKNYLIIDSKDNILPTMIGTIASILAKGKELPNDIFILSMSRLNDGSTKISLRISGNNEEHDLLSMMNELVLCVDGQSGGHRYAAGAVIRTEAEEQFVDNAKKVFDRFYEDKNIKAKARQYK